jgi:hypothetical protein
MIDDRIAQLTAELLAADPALRSREAEVRALVSELCSLRDHAGIDPVFRDALERKLRAAGAVARPAARPAWWHMPSLYWGVGTVAVVLLVAINLLRTPSGPVQVALDVEQESESTSLAGTSGDAPMLMAARKDAGVQQAMQLIVEEFADGEPIPAQHTCDGADQRPTFLVSGVPAEAKSLLIVVDDFDTEPLWTHWTLMNIDPATTRISLGDLPPGAIEGITSWNTRGWRGPCPPSGTHRYAFRLFALDAVLDPSAGASPDALHAAYQDHIISTSVLNNPYTRAE